jgi:chaperonin GroES
MALTSLHDRVLARRLEEEETISGVIVIPDIAKEKSRRAEALAIGRGRRLANGTRIALVVQVGDRILISKFGGTDVDAAASSAEKAA